MNEVERAISLIELDEVMQCDCPKCIEDRWAFELALQALREKAEREQKPHTNADRIRGMSNEELAEWLTHLPKICTCHDHCELCIAQKECDKGCEGCIKDWLRQPAETEGTE